MIFKTFGIVNKSASYIMYYEHFSPFKTLLTLFFSTEKLCSFFSYSVRFVILWYYMITKAACLLLSCLFEVFNIIIYDYLPRKSIRNICSHGLCVLFFLLNKRLFLLMSSPVGFYTLILIQVGLSSQIIYLVMFFSHKSPLPK